MSEPNPTMRLKLKVVAYEPCENKEHWGKPCDRQKKVSGTYENVDDLFTAAFAAFVQANIMNSNANPNVKDTGGTSRAINANSAVSALTIVAGTGTTAAAVSDNALQGTITNTSGASIAYSEVGITVTAATFVFLIAHDVFTALNVSKNGTLQVTYTATNQ